MAIPRIRISYLGRHDKCVKMCFLDKDIHLHAYFHGGIVEVKHIGHDLEGVEKRMCVHVAAKHMDLVHILVIAQAFNPFVHGM